MFTWTQPIGGKKIEWRPLKVGDHIDLDSNFSGANMSHLKPIAILGARIISIDGVEKSKLQRDDVGLLRDWEDYDLLQFKEEIESRELARSVALAPQRPGSAVTSVEQAVNKVQVACNELAYELTTMVQKAKEAEQKLGPLK